MAKNKKKKKANSCNDCKNNVSDDNNLCNDSMDKSNLNKSNL